jgi:hypothetical protein
MGALFGSLGGAEIGAIGVKSFFTNSSGLLSTAADSIHNANTGTASNIVPDATSTKSVAQPVPNQNIPDPNFDKLFQFY